jgi:outer membrane lipoprotein-sorting protein
MQRVLRFIPPALASIAAAALCLGAQAANTAPAIDAFRAAFASVNDYTYKMHSHEISGTHVQDRIYDYSYMKPHFAKTYIEAGDGQGSGGVWAGGDQVSGHQGGILSFVHLKISIHDPRATSIRGYTIPDGLLQNMVETYADVPGRLSQTNGGTVMGVPTDRLELDVADPASNGGISKQVIYFDQNTHFPIRQFLYQGDTIVLDQTIYDLKLNAGLTQADFPF